MFFAPFGIIVNAPPFWVTICLPLLSSGGGIVRTSLYSSFCFLSIASSVDSVPSKSITQSLEWNALLSSASFQLIELGGICPSLYSLVSFSRDLITPPWICRSLTCHLPPAATLPAP